MLAFQFFTTERAELEPEATTAKKGDLPGKLAQKLKNGMEMVEKE